MDIILTQPNILVDTLSDGTKTIDWPIVLTYG